MMIFKFYLLTYITSFEGKNIKFYTEVPKTSKIHHVSGLEGVKMKKLFLCRIFGRG